MFLSSLFFFVATSPPAKKTNGLCRWVNWITINSLSNLFDLSSPPSLLPVWTSRSISSSQHANKTMPGYRNHHLSWNDKEKSEANKLLSSLPFPIIDPLRTIHAIQIHLFTQAPLPILLAKKKRPPSPPPSPARLSSATASTPRNHDQLDYTERKTPSRISRFHEKYWVERKDFLYLFPLKIS